MRGPRGKHVHLHLGKSRDARDAKRCLHATSHVQRVFAVSGHDCRAHAAIIIYSYVITISHTLYFACTVLHHRKPRQAQVHLGQRVHSEHMCRRCWKTLRHAMERFKRAVASKYPLRSPAGPPAAVVQVIVTFTPHGDLPVTWHTCRMRWPKLTPHELRCVCYAAMHFQHANA